MPGSPFPSQEPRGGCDASVLRAERWPQHSLCQGGCEQRGTSSCSRVRAVSSSWAGWRQGYLGACPIAIAIPRMGTPGIAVPLPACSSAQGTEAFPSKPCSSLAAPQLGILHSGSTWEHHASRTGTGLGAGQIFPSLSCFQTLCSPPFSLLDASGLPVYGEEQEAMAFIQTFVRLSCQVTAACWMVAVPCCSPRALVLLATFSDALLSLCPLAVR